MMFYIHVQNLKTGETRYFERFDTLGNVVTTSNIAHAFCFDIIPGLVKARVVREFEFIGDDRDFSISISDF
jgi:hypothetical protein